MGTVVYQTGYIVLWHFGELLLENALEACEDDEALALVVIINNTELNLAISFLDNCRLCQG